MISVIILLYHLGSSSLLWSPLWSVASYYFLSYWIRRIHLLKSCSQNPSLRLLLCSSRKLLCCKLAKILRTLFIFIFFVQNFMVMNEIRFVICEGYRTVWRRALMQLFSRYMVVKRQTYQIRNRPRNQDRQIVNPIWFVFRCQPKDLGESEKDIMSITVQYMQSG